MERIPVMEKKIFLRKKGLTEEMVEEAFKRFEVKQQQKLKDAQKKQKEKQPTIAMPTTASYSTTNPKEDKK